MRWSGPPRRSRYVGAALLAATGCGQLLGVSDYKTSTPIEPDAGGTPAVETRLPLLPARLSDSVRLTCESCVRDHCADRYEECKKSARCRALLVCEAECDNPNCIANCEADHPPSPAFDDYFACAFNTRIWSRTSSECRTECNAGDDWDCRGGYAWAAEAGSRSAEFVDATFYEMVSSDTLFTFAGVPFAHCTDGVFSTLGGDSGCDTAVPIDPWGRVRVGLGGVDVFALLGREQHRLYPRPLVRSGPLLFPLFSRGSAEAIQHDIGYDPKLGVVHFAQFDCLGELASAEVTVDAPGPATQRYYWVDYANYDLKAQTGGLGGFLDVPLTRQMEVRGSGVEGLRSRKTILVASGWITDVYLYPLTKSEAGR